MLLGEKWSDPIYSAVESLSNDTLDVFYLINIFLKHVL